MKDLAILFLQFLKQAAKKTPNTYDDLAIELIEIAINRLLVSTPEEQIKK